MTKLNIDTGTLGNPATGDTLRTAMTKVNTNFGEVYSLIGDGATGLITTSVTNGDLKLQANGSGAIEIDTLSITNSIITSIATNSDITLTPNGTGDVVISALRVNGTTLNSSDSTKITLAENVDITGNLVVGGTLDLSGLAVGTLNVDNLNFNDNIISSDSNADINITPGGTGSVVASGVRIKGTTLSADDSATININEGLVVDGTMNVSGATTFVGNLSVGGNLDVTGTLDLSDSNFTNVGALQLDSIAGDGDTNTSITFSGSDVITVATGGSTAATFNADQTTTFSGAVAGTSADFDGGVTIDNITIDGTQIDLSSGDLTIDVAGDLILEAGADVNIPANIGLTFGDDGEKIEGNGTDLTIASSNDLNLTATTDINIPANIGLTFGDDGEKIEGDGTNLLISSSGTATITATGSTVVTNNLTVGGNLDVTGTLDLSDSNFTNVGSLQLDSIAGDGDTNTSITFSGSDVITIATGGSTALTVNADQTTTFSGAVTISGGQAIPGKIEGTNFNDSLLIGHSTTGTLNDAERNTGVGINALDALTSGDDNTAIGRNAGSSVTSGASNTYVGQAAGNSTTSASENTAVGSLALKTVTTSGTQNTALGFEALELVNSGDHNVGIGWKAGDSLTSGRGNVLIGSNVEAASNTGDRQLTIGGYDGSTTTTWISGDSSGVVTIDGGIDIGDANISYGTATTTSSSAANMDTFAAATYRSAKYQVSIVDSTNTKFGIYEVFVTHDGSAAYINAQGISDTGLDLATFSADIDSGSVRVRVIPISDASTVFKFVRTVFTV